jgi:hypothetical protein
MQEFLVLIVIALVIFYLPRVIGRKPAPVRAVRPTAWTGWMRLAVLVTIFWIAGSAAFLEPWQRDARSFLYLGLGPVAAVWGAAWVWFGYKKYRR